jgi:hypothetical protein
MECDVIPNVTVKYVKTDEFVCVKFLPTNAVSSAPLVVATAC